MFDFAWTHLFLVLVIAVVLLGPKELPMVLRFLGRTTAKIRQHTSEFREYFEAIADAADPTKSPPANDDNQDQDIPVKKAD